MSYIDTIDSEFVGYFGGIPVYHPLEVLPGGTGDPTDFACGPENLVIGDGGGGHLAIVVKSPAKAVGYFVDSWLDSQGDLSDEDFEKLRPDIETWRRNFGTLSWKGDWREVLEFAGWDAEYYVRFVESCKSKSHVRPFRIYDDVYESLEQWLAASVGEFVLLAMPELAPEVTEPLEQYREYFSKGRIYCNILLAPPGYTVWGRRMIDDRVVWGNSAWRIERSK